MASPPYYVMIVQDVLFATITVLAFVYSCLILSIRRFRHLNNIFILNICVSLMAFSIYYIVFATSAVLYPSFLYAPARCSVLFFMFNFVTLTTPCSFVVFTIHRFCSIIYHRKPFFTTKKWVLISIGSQRIIEFLVCTPYIILQQPGCSNQIWMRYYTFINSLIVPSIINTFFNALIFKHVRDSTRRIHPQMPSVSVTNGSINPRRPKISRREISLLKQMILMFILFVGGWTPAYAINIANIYVILDPLVNRLNQVVDELAILCIIINFYLCNHEIKEYLVTKFRPFFPCG